MRRRKFLGVAGSVIAGHAIWPSLVLAAPDEDVVEITMSGTPNGARVWFEPASLRIRPGQTVRWVNQDKGNAHTATAYHPDNDDHPLRIPVDAQSFDSDYLLPDESFEVTLDVPGIYDYYCTPHELAGMVGRIIVADADTDAFEDYSDTDLPQAAADAFAKLDADQPDDGG